MAVNLNALILSDNEDNLENNFPLVVISKGDIDSTHSPPALDGDSDSDSSYGEHAKEAAETGIDQLIIEAEAHKIEKMNRIKKARFERSKELDKQTVESGHRKHFNNSRRSKEVPSNSGAVNPAKCTNNRNHFKTSSNNHNQIRANNKPKDNHFNPVISKSEDRNNSIGNKKEPKLSVNNAVDVDLSSKLRNITLQEFDIDSTDSSDYESDNSSNNLSDSELKGKMKLFTIRNLNWGTASMIDVEDMVLPEEESDDEIEEEKKPKPLFSMVSNRSAEKSSAAQRRKRSNQLKKRYSNFTPGQNAGNERIRCNDDKDPLQHSPVDGGSKMRYNNKKGNGKNQTKLKSPNHQESSEKIQDVQNNLQQNSKCKGLLYSKNLIKGSDETNKIDVSPDPSQEKPTTSKSKKSKKNSKDILTPKKMNRNYDKKMEKLNENVISEIKQSEPTRSKSSTSKSKEKKYDSIKNLNKQSDLSRKINKQSEKESNKIDSPIRNYNKNIKKDKFSEKEKKNQKLFKSNNEEIAKDTDTSFAILEERWLVKKPDDSTVQSNTEKSAQSKGILKKSEDRNDKSKSILNKSDSSDNDVGRSLFKCSKLESVTISAPYSDSESDDIDFTEIIKERQSKTEKLSGMVDKKGCSTSTISSQSKKQQSDSSSDFEAEFDACLQSTKSKFHNYLNK